MLPDVLGPGLRIVFCGSAVGAASERAGAYYAGPGNRFWITLAEIGLTTTLLRPDEFRRLPEFGLGLTDLVKHQAGNDNAIRFGKVDGRQLTESILSCQPQYLCFNGKRAAQEYFGTRTIAYGLQGPQIGATSIFVAPSTSGAARRYWDLKVWDDLAAAVRPKRGESR